MSEILQYCKIHNKSEQQQNSKNRTIATVDLGTTGPDFIVTIKIGNKLYENEVISRKFVLCNVKPGYNRDAIKSKGFMVISEAKLAKYIQAKYASKQLSLF